MSQHHLLNTHKPWGDPWGAFTLLLQYHKEVREGADALFDVGHDLPHAIRGDAQLVLLEIFVEEVVGHLDRISQTLLGVVAHLDLQEAPVPFGHPERDLRLLSGAFRRLYEIAPSDELKLLQGGLER